MFNFSHLSHPYSIILWNLFMLLAPLAALLVQWKEGRRRHFPMLLWLTLVAVVQAALVLGARLGAISPTEWQALFAGEAWPAPGGKVILGGFALALMVYPLFHRWWKLPLAMADVMMLSLPLAAATGRLGCLFAGCCYGAVCSSGMGIVYGPDTPAWEAQVGAALIGPEAPASLPVYPVQLWLVLGNLLIFIVLWRLRKQLEQRAGNLALLALALLAANRFFSEFFRDVASNGGWSGWMIGGLKLAHWLSLFAGITAATLLLYRQKKVLPTPDHSAAQTPLTQPLAVLTAISLMAFGSSGLLSLDEKGNILLVCIPPLILAFQHLFQQNSSRMQQVSQVALMATSFVALTVAPPDSIRPVVDKLPEHTFEIGGSGFNGSWAWVSKDVCGHETRTNVSTESYAGEVAYKYRNHKNIQLGLGYRNARGRINRQVEEPWLRSRDTASFTTHGFFATLDHQYYGFKIGAMATPKDLFNQNAKEIKLLPIIAARVGPISTVSVDFRLYDTPGMTSYSESAISIGLANWGFEDPTGNTNVRLGMVLLNKTAGVSLSGRIPLFKKHLILDGGLMLGGRKKNVSFNGGIKYRFYSNK